MFLKTLNNMEELDPSESKLKYIYSSCRNKICDRDTNTNFSKLMGVSITLFVLLYMIFGTSIGTGSKILNFAKNQQLTKMFIGLIILSNLKNLSNSFINNIILPVLEPLLPFLECSFRLKIGPFDINFGNFASDMLIFVFNIYAIYLIYGTLQ